MRGPDPTLYLRRARELVGHNECIMGILDSYPPEVDDITVDQLKAVEHACIDWRWRLKGFEHRVRQVHPRMVRHKLMAFVQAVLHVPALDPACVNEYLG